MSVWASEYALNIASSLFWPAIAVTIVGIPVIIHAFWERYRVGWGSPQAQDARWRVLTFTQGLAAIWVIWGLLNAVPAPDYIYRTKNIVHTVVNEKHVLPKFVEAYNECYNRTTAFRHFTDVDRGRCEAVAQAQSDPSIKYVRTVVPKVTYKFKDRTITKTITKRIVIHPRYSNFYKDCIDSTSYNVDSNYMKLCHNQALRAMRMSQIDQKLMTELAEREARAYKQIKQK